MSTNKFKEESRNKSKKKELNKKTNTEVIFKSINIK